ncbi:MAG TPA: DMT family transporter [Dongiaceae bacterium]|nr:DMT family transporter [Dongiaceae bacterium]
MSLSVFCSAFGPVLVRDSPVDAASTAFWRLGFLLLPTLILARQTGTKVAGKRRWLAPMPGRDTALALLAGALYAADLVLWNGAILRTTVMEATVLVMLYPLLVALIGAWLLKQRAGWRLWTGCLICFAGIVLMSLRHAGGHSDTVGNAMAISAAFFYAGCFLITAQLCRRHAALTVTFWQSLGAVICALPFSLIEPRFLPGDLDGWLYMLGYSVITLTALIALTRALKTLSAALAAILAYGQPLLATLMAALLFQELPAANAVVGGFVIILGLFLATRDKPKSAAADTVAAE